MALIVFDDCKSIQNFLREQVSKKIGFVPTMGNLHQGHLSLIKSSVLENDLSVISIFVNPTQFGPNEDFDKYPRTLKKDLELIEATFKKNIDDDIQTIIVFAPKNSKEIYPKGFSSSIHVGGKMRAIMCDLSRPSHFDGVTTVVYLLLKIINPDNVYFGKKDYQQLLLITKMVNDLLLKNNVISCPIIREKSGLAMSSRNNYLSAEDKKEALVLHNSLVAIRDCYLKEGKKSALKLVEKIKKIHSNFEYIHYLEDKDICLFAAALLVKDIRLIDNIEVYD